MLAVLIQQFNINQHLGIAKLTQHCAEKILQGLHDKMAPFIVEDINDIDKFINTLLTLAEHLNRVRYCQDWNVGSIKVKDFGKEE